MELVIGKVYRAKAGTMSMWDSPCLYGQVRPGRSREGHLGWLDRGETFLLVAMKSGDNLIHLHILTGKANGWIDTSSECPFNQYFGNVYEQEFNEEDEL